MPSIRSTDVKSGRKQTRADGRASAASPLSASRHARDRRDAAGDDGAAPRQRGVWWRRCARPRRGGRAGRRPAPQSHASSGRASAATAAPPAGRGAALGVRPRRCGLRGGAAAGTACGHGRLAAPGRRPAGGRLGLAGAGPRRRRCAGPWPPATPARRGRPGRSVMSLRSSSGTSSRSASLRARQDHRVDAGALRRQHLLLEAADGQHLAAAA